MIYQIIIEKVFFVDYQLRATRVVINHHLKEKKDMSFHIFGDKFIFIKTETYFNPDSIPSPIRIFPVSHHLELETPKSIKDSINLSCLATLALPRSRSPPTAPPTLVDIRHILSPATARRRDVESRLTVTRVDMTPARDWPRRGVGSALQFATPSEPFRPCGSFPHFTTTGHLAEPCCRFIARYVTYDAEVFDENMEF